MRIAVVTEALTNHSGSRAPINLALALSKLKNKVTILALSKNSDKSLKKKLENQGLVVILLEKPKLISGFKFLIILYKLKPDIISFHATTTFLIFAKLTNIPIVKTFYGTQLDAHYENKFPKIPTLADKTINYMLNFAVLFLENLQLLLSDQTIAISTYTSKQAKRLFGKKIKYIYLGSNLIETGTNTKSNKFILSVSRFTPYKGFHRLAQIIKDFPLILAGSPEKKEYLNYIKKTKGENCEIKVDVTDKELANLYQNCLFLASLDKYPFFGMPILEAASFGKPTIALNYGAVPELIKNSKTGYIANNEEEFRKLSEKLIMDPAIAQKLGKNAKTRSRDFDWTKTASEYLKVFQKVKSGFLFSMEIILIIVAGIILRIAFVNQHDFWFDEAFSYFIARQNITGSIIASLGDNTPPLYYIILNLWIKISGPNYIWARSLSAIFGIITIPTVYFFTKKIFSKKIARISTSICALSPLFIYFSQETRMYTFLTFLTLASVYFFYLYLKNQNLKYLILFNIFLILAIYVHYISILLIIPYYIQTIKTKMQVLIRNFLTSQLWVLIFILPLLYGYLSFMRPAVFSTPFYIALPATFVSFIAGGTGVFSLRNYFESPILLSVLIISSVFFTLLFFKALIKVKNSYHQMSSVIFLFTPLVILSLVSLFVPVFSVRSTIILAPFFYILIARALSILPTFLTYFAYFLLLATDILLLISPNLKGPSLKHVADLLPQNVTIAHTSVLSYYSFRYYKPSSNNLLIGTNPLSATTQSIIGGKVVNLDALPQTFYLIESKNGQNESEVNQINNRLLEKYSQLDSWNQQELAVKLLSK